MANGYLGVFETDQCKDWTPAQWVLTYIEVYGGIDGEHHKTWVLDQVARILRGTPVICKEARWSDRQAELRFHTGEPSEEYKQWVEEVRGEYDEKYGEYEYPYDVGVAP